jgi:hypothetical protein
MALFSTNSGDGDAVREIKQGYILEWVCRPDGDKTPLTSPPEPEQLELF